MLFALGYYFFYLFSFSLVISRHYFKITISVTTLLIYAEKMHKWNNFSIYNRNTYLNKQILLFQELVTKALNKYNTDIKALKRQISELTTWTYEKKKRFQRKIPSFIKSLVLSIGLKCARITN
jgi:hypothetical protein